MTRSPPAIREAPSPGVESGTVLPSIGGGDLALTERLVSVVAEARSAPGPVRAGLAGVVNALMARLPGEVGPEASASLLHRLLEEGLLEGLEDTEGLPCVLVATRTQLELGYPHALKVSPERLAALRRWRRRPTPLPWVGMMLVLFVTFVVQVAVVTLGAPGMHTPFRVSAAVLAGGVPMPEPTWVDTVASALQDSAMDVFLWQQLLGALGFLLAVALGWHAQVRPWVFRGFLALGGLGLLVGGVQLMAEGWITASTWVGAAGALSCAWLLKER